MLAVNWSSTQLKELDLASTELSEKALLTLFAAMPKFMYLAVPFCDGFTDKVLKVLVDHGKLNGCRALDFSNTVNLSAEAMHRLLTTLPNITQHLEALSYTGNGAITEQFWIDTIRFIHKL
ncbi:unnamed protein product, partial [Adineta ricciae]